jgi:hypothetical protein
MAIYFNCPGCSRRLRVADEMAGKKSRCPKCDALGKIPEVSQPAIQRAADVDEGVDEAPAPPLGSQDKNSFEFTDQPVSRKPTRRAPVDQEEDEKPANISSRRPPPPDEEEEEEKAARASKRRPPPEEDDDEEYERPIRRNLSDPKENRAVVAMGLNLIRIGAVVQYAGMLLMAAIVVLVVVLFGTAALAMSASINQAQPIRPLPPPGQRPPTGPVVPVAPPTVSPPSNTTVAAAGTAIIFFFLLLGLGGLAMLAAFVLRLIGQIQCLWAPEADGMRGWAIGMVCTQCAAVLLGCVGGYAGRDAGSASTLLSFFVPLANEICLLIFLWQMARFRRNEELTHEVTVYAVIWLVGGFLAALVAIGGYFFAFAAAIGVGMSSQSAGGGVATFVVTAVIVGLLVFGITGYILLRYIGLLTLANQVAGRGRALRAS